MPTRDHNAHLQVIRNLINRAILPADLENVPEERVGINAVTGFEEFRHLFGLHRQLDVTACTESEDHGGHRDEEPDIRYGYLAALQSQLLAVS